MKITRYQKDFIEYIQTEVNKLGYDVPVAWAVLFLINAEETLKNFFEHDPFNDQGDEFEDLMKAIKKSLPDPLSEMLCQEAL